MSVCNADPWQVKNNSIELQQQKITNEVQSFEDNFASHKDNNKQQEAVEEEEEEEHQDVDVVGKTSSVARPPHEPLPDSANYLQLLERKLAKVQKGSKLLDSLQEKRQDCMRLLLASSNGSALIEEQLELDTPIESGRLQRHLLPHQALTVGELVNIVKHDALEEQQEHSEEETH
ncbi:uncharacterized protein LOC6650636 [Drosophila willistoni]|nr:uncharacterized protein LOC6650636 [Drosophila willistoni]